MHAVADGILDTSVTQKQQCLDRYATSKLCLLLFLYESARRIPPSRVRFVAFDPGLMPGTELARDRGLGEQLAWKYLLPILGRFIPGVSNPKRSARTLSRLLTNPAIAPGTGQHFDYRLKQTQTSVDSRRRDWQRNLYQKSLELCALDSSITP